MALEAIRILGDDRVDLGVVVAIIEKSPEFAARILRCANSAYYGCHGKVASVRDAVIRVLGLSMTKSLILATALADSFDLSCPGFSRERFWFGSVACAQLSHDLTGSLLTQEKPAPAVAYTAGLLHDFGLLALVHAFPDQVEQALTCSRNRDSLSKTIETATGLSPAQAGEWLGLRWGFPENLIEVMASHRVPDYRGKGWPLVRLVGLAAQIADGLFTAKPQQPAPSNLPGDFLNTEVAGAAVARLTQQMDELLELAHLLAGKDN
jgi:HD-like signal output (HDOD) protein